MFTRHLLSINIISLIKNNLNSRFKSCKWRRFFIDFRIRKVKCRREQRRQPISLWLNNAVTSNHKPQILRYLLRLLLNAVPRLANDLPEVGERGRFLRFLNNIDCCLECVVGSLLAPKRERFTKQTFQSLRHVCELRLRSEQTVRYFCVEDFVC